MLCSVWSCNAPHGHVVPLAWPSQCAFHRLPAGPSLVVLPCVRAMQPSMPGNLTWAMQDTLSLRTSAKREVPLHALWPVRPVWPSAIRLGVVWWGRRTSLRSMSCAAGGKVCREWQQALDFPSRAFRPHDSACPHCTRRRGDLQEGQEVRPEGPIHTRASLHASVALHSILHACRVPSHCTSFPRPCAPRSSYAPRAPVIVAGLQGQGPLGTGG